MPDGRLFCPCREARPEAFTHAGVHFIPAPRAQYCFYATPDRLLDHVKRRRCVLCPFIQKEPGHRAERETLEQDEREEAVLY